ncbi:hypothetical protein MXB_41 [Myxobolus squamalis]|nr:hypothetical protein MXB_41 [Myxobolus squamalis]
MKMRHKGESGDAITLITQHDINILPDLNKRFKKERERLCSKSPTTLGIKSSRPGLGFSSTSPSKTIPTSLEQIHSTHILNPSIKNNKLDRLKASLSESYKTFKKSTTSLSSQRSTVTTSACKRKFEDPELPLKKSRWDR